MKAERRTLQEQIGTAVNASVLTLRSHETPLERVAALGAATLHVQTGAARLGVPVATVAHLAPEPADVLIAKLASSLWHLLHGGQDAELGNAVDLLENWVSGRARMAGADQKLMRPFAARVLHELLSPCCIACGGGGREELSRSGTLIRPRGSMQRNAVFRVCRTCGGSGRRPASSTERRMALGIDAARYDAERWDRRFEAGRHWCVRLIMPILREPLTVQLERRRKRK